MNLRQVEVFRAVMRAGSVSGGAAALHVSAPAVSRMLSHLEAKLGVRLFHRRGTRLQPTPEARTLLGEIEAAWRHIERVRGTALALRHGAGSTLRVGTNLSTGLELVPRALAAMRRTWPALRTTVEVATLTAMRDALDSGEMDVAVGAFVDLDAGALQRWPLGSGQIRAVLPAGHALAALDVVPLSALAAEPLIAFGLAGSHGQRIEALLGARAAPPALEVPYAYMACALVACGAGVALVDDLTLRHFQGSGVQARPLRPQVACSIEALTDPRRAANAAVPDFVAALRAAHAAATGS